MSPHSRESTNAMIKVEYALSYTKYEEILLPVLDRLLTEVGRYRTRLRVEGEQSYGASSCGHVIMTAW